MRAKGEFIKAMENKKNIPQFRSEKEEREFWAKHDSSEYIDWHQETEKAVLSSLKPSTKNISIRMPETMLNELKLLANKRDVPYQSFIKVILAEKIRKEFGIAS